ncbi:MAG: HAD family hydrolase [Spirochaetes bacterium]|nr:HAD family hydrolase [Spirochaetota bacterium]
MTTLYVSDLDGTLVRDDLTLSAEARRDLCALLGEGALITVASARSVTSIRAILGDIPFTLPIIEFNGAFLSEYRTGRHEIVNAIPTALAREVFAALTGGGCEPYVSSFDGTHDVVFYREIANEGMAAYFAERVAFKDERLRRVDDLAATLDGGTVCLTVIDRGERLDPVQASLAAAFGEQVVLTSCDYRCFPGWKFFTVHDRRATKDQAIAALRKARGLEEAGLVVFGDDVNDLGMMQAADRPIAMANAKPEVKVLARELIGSNNEDSVVRCIRQDWLGSKGR